MAQKDKSKRVGQKQAVQGKRRQVEKTLKWQ